MSVNPTSSTPESPPVPSESTSSEAKAPANSLVETNRKNADGLAIWEDVTTGHEFVNYVDRESGDAFLLDAQTGAWVLTDNKGAPLYDESGQPLTIDLALSYDTTMTLAEMLNLARILLAAPNTKEALKNNEIEEELEDQKIEEQKAIEEQQKEEQIAQTFEELKIRVDILSEQLAAASSTLEAANKTQTPK